MSTDPAPFLDLLDVDYPVRIPDKDKLFLRTLASDLKVPLCVSSNPRGTEVHVGLFAFSFWDSGAWTFHRVPVREHSGGTSPSPAAAYRSYLSMLRERVATEELRLQRLDSVSPTKEST